MDGAEENEAIVMIEILILNEDIFAAPNAFNLISTNREQCSSMIYLIHLYGSISEVIEKTVHFVNIAI